ncbi:hypothetical protein [Parvularcula dongshanensis]|uniref:Glycosyltransferase family 2 protein n=1 Tax=Parvularcula dongshanensis TaxID=1173995 RepID=A0A840I2R5_9PROT|nr:hypothetical protein [Parvularcula dongshanensis]MBB4658340.1 hypothetical protein [Parvularcula dongshanensis]
MARQCDLDAAIALCERLVPPLAEAVILLDADEVPSVRLPEKVRLYAEPFAGDFAARRNAVQRLAASSWVLQLDTDETMPLSSVARLGTVLRHAARDGVTSLGLPRRNLVDGRLSDLYPDPQYRLNRRFVRFAGVVHERPALLSRPRHARLALGAPIEHHLSAARVRARTEVYGAMAKGGARPSDEAALLTPFRP